MNNQDHLVGQLTNHIMSVNQRSFLPQSSVAFYKLPICWHVNDKGFLSYNANLCNYHFVTVYRHFSQMIILPLFLTSFSNDNGRLEQVEPAAVEPPGRLETPSQCTSLRRSLLYFSVNFLYFSVCNFSS